MTFPNPSTVKETIEWLSNRGYTIPNSLRAKSIRFKLMNSREIKQADDYMPVRNELWSTIYENVYDYLTSDNTVRTYQNAVKQSIVESYSSTGDIAYQDGGGDLPVDEDTSSAITSEMNAQINYVDGLFQTLKQLKKDGEYDANSEATDTADRWSSALDGFYNTIKLSGAGNKMLTWNLGDTENHCGDCSSLDGQRHRASWFLGKGYTPRKPGSNTECGGYHCDCSLTDDDGEEFTI